MPTAALTAPLRAVSAAPLGLSLVSGAGTFLDGNGLAAMWLT